MGTVRELRRIVTARMRQILAQIAQDPREYSRALAHMETCVNCYAEQVSETDLIRLTLRALILPCNRR